MSDFRELNYRYTFDHRFKWEDIKQAHDNSLIAAESLHGAATIRRDVHYYLDPDYKTCVIGIDTPAGSDFSRIFAGFMRNLERRMNERMEEGEKK